MPKRILLVDDEESFLNSLKERLDSFSNIFETDVCYSVNGAIKHLVTKKYGMVITDIKMPGKTGIELLVYLRAIRFKGKVIVMSAYNTEEISRNMKTLGGVEVISKPFKIESFINMLLDWFSKSSKERTVTFETINLVTVMQIINMERKTSALEIKSGKKTGMIYFIDGEVIHSEFGVLEGEKAVSALIALKTSVISVKKFTGSIKRTVQIPFQKYIMKMMKSFDENQAGVDTEPVVQDLPLEFLGTEMSENGDQLEDLEDEIKGILRTLEGIDGFIGATVLSPQGRLLGGSTTLSTAHIREIGPMLRKSMNVSGEMSQSSGFGRLEMLQFYTEEGILLAMGSGKNHALFHTIIMLETNGDIATATLKLKKAVTLLADVI